MGGVAEGCRWEMRGVDGVWLTTPDGSKAAAAVMWCGVGEMTVATAAINRLPRSTLAPASAPQAWSRRRGGEPLKKGSSADSIGYPLDLSRPGRRVMVYEMGPAGACGWGEVDAEGGLQGRGKEVVWMGKGEVRGERGGAWEWVQWGSQAADKAVCPYQHTSRRCHAPCHYTLPSPTVFTFQVVPLIVTHTPDCPLLCLPRHQPRPSAAGAQPHRTGGTPIRQGQTLSNGMCIFILSTWHWLYRTALSFVKVSNGNL